MMSDSDIMQHTNSSVNIMNTNEYAELAKKKPSELKVPTVLNLDNVGHGTHWVAIKPDKNFTKGAAPAAHATQRNSVKILDYHDSFGVIPPFHLKNTIIKYNPYVEQKLSEVNCGERSINYLRKK